MLCHFVPPELATLRNLPSLGVQNLLAVPYNVFLLIGRRRAGSLATEKGFRRALREENR